jgi:hypothetical protein
MKISNLERADAARRGRPQDEMNTGLHGRRYRRRGKQVTRELKIQVNRCRSTNGGELLHSTGRGSGWQEARAEKITNDCLHIMKN